MIDYSKIKIVIWDLDETFWKGTLSEGEIEAIPEHIQLVKDLTDMGIINAVCSKNDKEYAEKTLKQLGIGEYFVFNSIDWQAKGNKIKKMLSDMGLRAVNALFLDDNHMNLEEAKFYNEGIMAAGPEFISELIKFCNENEKKDIQNKRLKQYKILEEKVKEKSTMKSNEEFLFSSDIRVEIKNNCLSEIDRLSEMVMRTNQLNFTKNRMEKEELIELIENENADSGYVVASDRFGEYGIVGLYVKMNNELIHFLFSCRTIGMGVEQYVYAKLGYPKLDIIGEVIGEVNNLPAPEWINQNVIIDKLVKESTKDARVLIKGPCDLKALFSYIELGDKVDCEFTFVNDKGISDEQINHTTHIVEANTLSDEQKNKLVEELFFADRNMFSDLIFKKTYNVVFLSVLNDVNLGLYKRKETGELVAFTEAYYPLTDPKNWQGYIDGEYWTAGFKFTTDVLEAFREKYEYIGRITAEKTIENIDYIREKLPESTLLVIMLGSEVPYEDNEFEAYEDRHILHAVYNQAVKEYSANKNNVKYLDVNNYIVGQNSFYKHINHFIPEVYYKMAQDMVKLINEWVGVDMAKSSKIMEIKGRAKILIKKLLRKM